MADASQRALVDDVQKGAGCCPCAYCRYQGSVCNRPVCRMQKLYVVSTNQSP